MVTYITGNTAHQEWKIRHRERLERSVCCVDYHDGYAGVFDINETMYKFSAMSLVFLTCFVFSCRAVVVSNPLKTMIISVIDFYSHSQKYHTTKSI